MKIIEKNLIHLDLAGTDKKEFLNSLCECLHREGVVDSAEEFFQAIWEREESFSTGIGRNIAIPHGKSSVVKELKILVGLIPAGIEYESLDSEPVNLIFMFAVPPEESDRYRVLLGKISAFTREDANRLELLASKTKEEILTIMSRILNEDKS